MWEDNITSEMMNAIMQNAVLENQQNAVPVAQDDPPEAHSGGYRVADLCHRWKVGADKVHGWIRRGELEAVNVATSLCGRPQYRITPESVRLFEERRSTAPPPKPTRRRRQPHLIDYWPDN